MSIALELFEQIKRSVFFICVQNADGAYAIRATGFFVAVSGSVPDLFFVFPVTALHNIIKAREEGYDKVYLRVNTKSGGVQYVPTPLANWRQHPAHIQGDEGVDIAFMRGGIDIREFDCGTLHENAFASKALINKEHIGELDDVFVLGLFGTRPGQQQNEPVALRGHIAAMPKTRVRTAGFDYIEAYIVELQSRGGFSGAPVFVRVSHVPAKGGSVTIGGPVFRWYLLGLMHGHWTLNAQIKADMIVAEDSFVGPDLHTGLSIVVPAEKILEALNSEEEREVRAREEAAFLARQAEHQS